ncbi:hypothetical protein [Halarchaeum sp. P4]|uniref:hypothetical protein n=1 Tax=Halarchaeum sp. P4 TaxID=3421639 RepID=UPI003EBF659E
MNVETLASRQFAAAVALAVVGAFGAYFVVVALVPDLFGPWPHDAMQAVVAAATLVFAVTFLVRAALGRGPTAWRLAYGVAAAVCLVLVAQAASFVLESPLAVSADTAPVALVHLILWAGVVSTVVLLRTALSAAEGRVVDPSDDR